tara:strand:- start:18234 stop:20246 length:2013 start_codon:yes stop_codon:yes gene_type:complete
MTGAVMVSSVGCGLLHKIPDGPHDTKTSYHDNFGMRIEYPEVAECAATPASAAASAAAAPLALEDPANLPAREMSLEEAINLAVSQSPILRNIGGTVVSAPAATSSIYDPALASANPALGPEAALSAFDAQYSQQLFWNNIDRPLNRQPFDAGAFVIAPFSQSQNATFSAELSKQSATGASFALRHVVNYARNQDPSVAAQVFPSDFTGWVEAEWRQPFLQGAGTTFNRIAGPTTVPGQYNGVLIGRVTEDVALADFEASIIQLVADVEEAYWDLFTAYRVLDTVVRGRESALQTFQYQQVRLEVGTGRRDEEAQARSQYYQFQAQVESSLGGTTGLYALEQRLRYLVGLPATDGQLIRPTTSPTDVRVVFDWNSALGQSLDRRVEVRRQRFNVKRRELELTAARLNLRPRLDFLGQYRWRGLGNHLIGDTDKGALDNLYDSISDGNYQEWQAGLELQLPVGMRLASVAVSHAKLNLKRERALLSETELRISHDLSNAARQIALTHQLLETNYNRYMADLRQVDVLLRRYRDGTDNINFLLQAQRQVVASEAEFYRALSDYNLAIRDFHRNKGSLLAYNHVHLAEGPWTAGARHDAYEVGRFLTPRRNPGDVYVPRPLTSGEFEPSEIQSTSAMQGMIADEGMLDTDGVVEIYTEPLEQGLQWEGDATVE